MNKPYKLWTGDCREVVGYGYAENTFDSIVCDPPYGLEFMDKAWDKGVPGVEFWTHALRAAKPGAHLLAFGGTRTFHRLACAIEDAGWEIRDCIMWVYGTGFSKGFNLRRAGCCTCQGKAIPYSQPAKEGQHGKPATEHDMRLLRESDLQAARSAGEEHNESMFTSMQQLPAGLQSIAHAGRDCEASGENDGHAESSMERRQVYRAGEGVRDDSEAGSSEGEAQRLCAGAHIDCGANAGTTVDGYRGGTPYQSQQGRQQAGEPEGVQQSFGTLDAGALHGRGACPRCGKLKAEYEGWGTALKPAWEPIIVAQKPMKTTVAQNVLKHGTGAINIEGCRVGTGADKGVWPITQRRHNDVAWTVQPVETDNNSGRWPANLIHDGSEEVVGLFPQSKAGKETKERGKGGIWSPSSGTPAGPQYGDTGSAARFFYCAKASRKDREEGCEGLELVTHQSGMGGAMPVDDDGNARDRLKAQSRNHHPTVKPTDLMRYLVRLVTAPGGLVLDPFMGSGSTGKAAMLEGMRFVGVDLNAEYVEIAKSRIEHALTARTELEGE
jgi:DNA modification methylase